MEKPYIIYLDKHIIVREVAHTLAAIKSSARPITRAGPLFLSFMIARIVSAAAAR